MARRGSNGVRTPVIRNLAGAIGLVLVVAAAFTLVGSYVEQPAAAPDTPAEEPAEAEQPDDADAPEAADVSDGKVMGSVIARTPDTDDADADDPDADAPDADEPDEDGRIPPDSIRIQVLDGYGVDGGTAAANVTEELREAGYQIVAENAAIAYDTTTVLWNDGYEDEAHQIAEDLGATEVREQPGNLSADVMVHIVVGADRG